MKKPIVADELQFNIHSPIGRPLAPWRLLGCCVVNGARPSHTLYGYLKYKINFFVCQ